MPQSTAVLAQLNYDNMAPLASGIRQSIETVHHEKFSPTNAALWSGCRVAPNRISQQGFGMHRPRHRWYGDRTDWERDLRKIQSSASAHQHNQAT